MIYSYAQALEDVLLFRALRHVDQGFYIDVGAFHPETDSVTKLFYERGWAGINIEASPSHFAPFLRDRPRDVNLNVAASDTSGQLTFHQVEDTGLSTLLAENVDKHRRSGFSSTTYDVPAMTLATICEAHVRTDVHFLKIDVEGAEPAVLKGADFSACRPWIVVVEAVEPLSSVPNHESWEYLLLQSDYIYTLFDGLNRYYVAKEHQELVLPLSFPADDYERATAYWTRDALREQLQVIDDNPSAHVGFRGDDSNRVYRGYIGGELPIAAAPQAVPLTSALCNQLHFSLDQYRFWCAQLKDKPKFLRKQWEFVFIAQALFEKGMLSPGKRGLAFGVGREPLPALFASFGAEVTATDQSIDDAIRAGWVASHEHSIDLSALNERGICTDRMFTDLVRFLPADMNDIDPALHGNYDFCWSACSLEHLGSLQRGLDFIENAMQVLVPGGVAVHTTEFNLTSNDATIESRDLSIYRQRDIEALVSRLGVLGYEVAPIDWTRGEGFVDRVVDLPPYGRGEPHLRLRLGEFDATSIALIITKPH